MLSDTLFEAIAEIDCCEKEFPEIYGHWRDHISIVKAVMGSLMELLDRVPVPNYRSFGTGMTEDKERFWRVCCEANLARWVECLRLLGPLSAEELVQRLDKAVERLEEALADGRPLGHAPELVREQFQFLVDTRPNGETGVTAEGHFGDLLTRLVDSEDILPDPYCHRLGLRIGSSYADAVASIRGAVVRGHTNAAVSTGRDLEPVGAT